MKKLRSERVLRLFIKDLMSLMDCYALRLAEHHGLARNSGELSLPRVDTVKSIELRGTRKIICVFTIGHSDRFL